MQNNDIEYLIKKYDKPYVSGEVQSRETNNSIKRNQRLEEKHLLCDSLLEELSFDFSHYQREFVHYLIDRFGNFKRLHAKAKNEAIILAFIFYVKKVEDSRINLNDYSVCKKYGLTDGVFVLIICRICDDYVKKSPMGYVESTSYDHEILSKNGGKLY